MFGRFGGPVDPARYSVDQQCAVRSCAAVRRTAPQYTRVLATAAARGAAAMLAHGLFGAMLVFSLAHRTKSADPPAALNCTCIDGAQDDEVSGALGWVCGAGGVDCGPINPGGSHFEPNTVVSHADYAFNQFWAAQQGHGYDPCFFNGIARLTPAPVGYFFLTHDEKLMYPWPSPPHDYVGQWDTIQEGHEKTYTRYPCCLLVGLPAFPLSNARVGVCDVAVGQRGVWRALQRKPVHFPTLGGVRLRRRRVRAREAALSPPL
jgi:hypothetical protein